MKILNILQHLGGCAPQTPCLMLYRTPLADILRTPLVCWQNYLVAVVTLTKAVFVEP